LSDPSYADAVCSLREEFLRDLKENILRNVNGVVNVADKDSASSREIAAIWAKLIPGTMGTEPISGQTAGKLFALNVKNYIEKSFRLLKDLRPGDWGLDTEKSIINYDQYFHLAFLDELARENRDLRVNIGSGYIITSDIVMFRYPIKVEKTCAIDYLSPLLKGAKYSQDKPILHASISCKWTIRSDRAQNIRTEALNLVRNRKGNTPHIVAVVAEPLPTRIASLALGTGDLDCVYHAGLHELRKACQQINNEDQLEMLEVMVEGRRLRDIADLPFDLAV